MADFTGLVIGGLGGALGGYFSSRERRRAQEEFRRRQAEGIAEARRITEDRVQSLLENPLIAQASGFIQSSFEGGADDPLTQQFRRQLRVAQEERGLRRSTAGAVAEASSLAAFRQRFLQSLLPSAMEFGTVGERFRQRILAQETPLEVASRTGAALPGFTPPEFIPSPMLSAFQGGIQGATGGFQIQQGLQQSQQSQQILDELRALREQSVSPSGSFGGAFRQQRQTEGIFGGGFGQGAF